MKKIGMLFIIMFEEFVRGYKQLPFNQFIRNTWHYLIPFVLFYGIANFSLIGAGVSAVGLSIVAVIMGLVALHEREFEAAAWMLSFIIATVLMFSINNIETVQSKSDVKLTGDIIKYMGYTKNISENRKSCETGLFTLKIKKETLLNIEETNLKVYCQEAPATVQEIE